MGLDDHDHGDIRFVEGYDRNALLVFSVTLISMNTKSFRVCLLSLLVLPVLGCVDDTRLFTEGRIEDLCNEAIPICGSQAACTLDNNEFFNGEFPGGQRYIVRTEFEDQKMFARFLLDDLAFPGTEILVKAFTPDCGDFDQKHPRNVDLFDLAGDDRVLEFEIDLPGRGDHLVEVFSDMSATYYMTFDVE